MKDFKKYLEQTKSQLNCNASEDYKNRYVTYLCSNEDVDNNLDYFEKCMKDGLSSYKALLFFYDYLNEK